MALDGHLFHHLAWHIHYMAHLSLDLAWYIVIFYVFCFPLSDRAVVTQFTFHILIGCLQLLSHLPFSHFSLPPLLTLSLMRDRRLLLLLLFLMRFVAPDLTFWLHLPRYFAFGLSQGWQFSNSHTRTLSCAHTSSPCRGNIQIRV